MQNPLFGPKVSKKLPEKLVSLEKTSLHKTKKKPFVPPIKEPTAKEVWLKAAPKEKVLFGVHKLVSVLVVALAIIMIQDCFLESGTIDYSFLKFLTMLVLVGGWLRLQMFSTLDFRIVKALGKSKHWREYLSLMVFMAGAVSICIGIINFVRNAEAINEKNFQSQKQNFQSQEQDKMAKATSKLENQIKANTALVFSKCKTTKVYDVRMKALIEANKNLWNKEPDSRPITSTDIMVYENAIKSETALILAAC